MSDDYLFESMRSAIRVSLPPGQFYDDCLNDLLDFHAESLSRKIRKEGAKTLGGEYDGWMGAADFIYPFADTGPEELGCPPGCTNPFCACPGTD